MISFKLWANFAVFRDPLTITQNLTLPIPPKTTIGGMLAAILGMEYNDYFQDKEYFNFLYSLVLLNPIRKKSFAQNYIADYTKISATKLDAIEKYKNADELVKRLDVEKNDIKYLQISDDDKKKKLLSIDKKINKAEESLRKNERVLSDKLISRFPKPKPIFRELLLNPSYLIFIKDYKFEKRLKEYLKNHYTEFSLYMGNSEFAANYEYVECNESEAPIDKLNSFTKQPENIKFLSDKKYTRVYSALRVVGDREYRDYQSLVVCDKEIILIKPVNGYTIKTEIGTFNCEFI